MKVSPELQQMYDDSNKRFEKIFQLIEERKRSINQTKELIDSCIIKVNIQLDKTDKFLKYLDEHPFLDKKRSE